jgi:hypothetical protein
MLDGALSKEAGFIEVIIIDQQRFLPTPDVAVAVGAHDIEHPVRGTVHLRRGGNQGDAITDLPAVLLRQPLPDDGSRSHLAESRVVFGRDREGERRKPALVGADRDDTQFLTGILIGGPEQLHRDDRLHAGYRLDRLEQAQRQGIDQTQAAVDDQQIRAGFADDMLNARFQALEHAKQREGDANLQKDQDGASRIAPDAGPYEGQKLHWWS